MKTKKQKTRHLSTLLLFIAAVAIMLPTAKVKAAKEPEFKAGQAFKAGETITYTPSIDMGNNCQSEFKYYDFDESPIEDKYTSGDSSYTLCKYEKGSQFSNSATLKITPASDFLGWIVMEDSIHNANDNEWALVTLKLKAIRKFSMSFNINYELNGGTNDTSNPTNYMAGYGRPKSDFKAPTRNGYSFAGWSIAGGLPSAFNGISSTDIGDITLYANWTPNTYDIDYIVDGVNVNSTLNVDGYPVSYTCSTREVIPTNNDPTKPHYQFIGWYKQIAGTVTDTRVTEITPEDYGDMILVAKFKLDNYKINYYLDGGVNNPANPAARDYGTAVTLLPATKEGYEFLGWYTGTVTPYTVIYDTKVETIAADYTSDITLIARYKSNINTGGSSTDKDGTTPSTPNPNNKKRITAADLDKLNKKSTKSESDLVNSSFGMLFARSIKYTKTSITLKWKKVDGADGYIIYGNRCNHKKKTYNYKYITTIKKASTTKWTAKKLQKNRYYKFYIAAYKNVNGEKEIICTSKTIHATTVSSEFGVAQSIKLNKKKTTLAVGKTFKIKAKEKNKSRRIASHRAICYESSDTNIATVDKNGKVKAVGAGTCKIWIYAQNGLYTVFTVTVK